MKHASGNTGNRRQRGRNRSGRGNGGNNRSQTFDSNGPDVRIRGTAQQIVDKYQVLAKDAASAGDMTMAENYFQHAEHYARIVMTYAAKMQESKAVSELSYGSKNNDDGSKDESDLSLPSSILGEKPDVKEKGLEVA